MGLVEVRSPQDWHGWRSAWDAPKPPTGWAAALQAEPSGRAAYELKARKEDGSEVWGMPLREPCVIFGSNLRAAHLADLTHDSVKAQHAALLLRSSGGFALEPINGRVRLGAAAELLRSVGEPTGVVSLPVGGGRQALDLGCCFRLAQSRLAFAVERSAQPQRSRSARRRHSPIGGKGREAPDDEEEQENAWRGRAARSAEAGRKDGSAGSRHRKQSFAKATAQSDGSGKAAETDQENCSDPPKKARRRGHRRCACLTESSDAEDEQEEAHERQTNGNRAQDGTDGRGSP